MAMMDEPIDNRYRIVDQHYLIHKDITTLEIVNGAGDKIYVSIDNNAPSKTRYYGTDSAKESPQTDDTIVGAGTDFLMKVTEEAVISGMILSQQNGRAKVRNPKVRDIYRRTAEDITLEELRRFTEFEAGSESLMEVTSTALHHSEDPACDLDDTETRAAHGVPASLDWVTTPRILPCDRYDPGKKVDEMTGDEFLAYLDATKGPSS